MIAKPTVYLSGMTILLGIVITIRQAIQYHPDRTDFSLMWILLIPFWLIGFIYILIAHYKYKTE